MGWHTGGKGRVVSMALDDETLAALRSIAEKRHATVTAIARSILMDWLDGPRERADSMFVDVQTPGRRRQVKPT